MQQRDRLLNGGYIALFLINLIVSVSFSMVSTTMSLYVTQLGNTASMAGTVVGALSVASLCMRPFSGLLSDRLERKRLLLASLTLIGAAMLGYGMTSSVGVLLALRIIHGIGFAAATTVTLALVAGVIPERQMTQGMGYFAIGQTIATAIAPTIGLWLGERFGLQTTFTLAAALIVVAIVLAGLLVRPVHRGKAAAGRPHWRDLIAVEALPFCMLSMAVAGATGLENSFVTLYGRELNMGNVGWYFTLSAAALFAARMFGGRLADRHMRVIMLGGLGMMTGAFALLSVAGSAAAAGVAALLLGLAAVMKALGLGVVQPALQSGSMRSVSRERRGAASSTYYLGADVGQALAPMAGGAVMEHFGTQAMFGSYMLPLVLGMGLYMIFTRTKEKGVGC